MEKRASRGTIEWYEEVEQHFLQDGGQWDLELLKEMSVEADMEEEWAEAEEIEPIVWKMFEKLGFS